MSNVKAVEDYVVINGVLTSRWFPQVPGFPAVSRPFLCSVPSRLISLLTKIQDTS